MDRMGKLLDEWNLMKGRIMPRRVGARHGAPSGGDVDPLR
jgi:hypothetical protein